MIWKSADDDDDVHKNDKISKPNTRLFCYIIALHRENQKQIHAQKLVKYVCKWWDDDDSCCCIVKFCDYDYDLAS